MKPHINLTGIRPQKGEAVRHIKLTTKSLSYENKSESVFAITLTIGKLIREAKMLSAEHGPEFYVNYLMTTAFGPEGYKEDAISKIVERARNGSREDHVAAGAIAVDMWQRQEPPFDCLKLYITDALDLACPRKTGQSPYKYFSRNWLIYVLITELVDTRGFKLTRNLATKGRRRSKESACSIVATALGVIGYHITEEGVKSAYDQFQEFLKM